jgi:hypothetical protein
VDVVGAAQAVALAGESEFGDGDGVLSECRDDRLGLLGGHHLVVEAVNDKDGVGDLVGIVEGGTLPVEVGRLWPWADEMIGVVTLEAGGVGAEGGEVCNAEPAGAGGEPVCGGERAQDGESARACAGNDGAVGVGVTSVGEERRDVDAVLYVQDAPVAVEVGAVGAAVAGATPVVDVDDGEAAAREELDAQFQPDTRASLVGPGCGCTISGGRCPGGPVTAWLVGG